MQYNQVMQVKKSMTVCPSTCTRSGVDLCCLHVWIGITLTSHYCSVWGMQTILLELICIYWLHGFSWMIKINFFLSYYNHNPHLEIHFQLVCTLAVTGILSAQSPAHYAVISALGESSRHCSVSGVWSTSYRVPGRKWKAWESMHLSNKWFLFTVGSTKACLSL